MRRHGIVVANKTWKTRGEEGRESGWKGRGAVQGGWRMFLQVGVMGPNLGLGSALLSLRSWFMGSPGNIHCEAVEVTGCHENKPPAESQNSHSIVVSQFSLLTNSSQICLCLSPLESSSKSLQYISACRALKGPRGLQAPAR